MVFDVHVEVPYNQTLTMTREWLSNAIDRDVDIGRGGEPAWARAAHNSQRRYVNMQCALNSNWTLMSTFANVDLHVGVEVPGSQTFTISLRQGTLSDNKDILTYSVR